MKRNLVCIIAMVAMATPSIIVIGSSAQAQVSDNGLRIGVIGAVNYNHVEAPIQKFVTVPGNPNFGSHDFSGANGFEAYYGLVGEYQFNDKIGATLRATVDARCVAKEENGSTFTPQILYVSIEPGLRLNIGTPDFHAMAGATVALNGSAKYDYSPGSGEGLQNIEGVELQNMRDLVFGAWAGIGYDIRLNDSRSDIGWFVTPFVEGSYIFDQKNPDGVLTEDEYWNTLTGRAGVRVMVQF